MAKKMTKRVGPIILGNIYKDTLHDRKGKATCYATHLTGCSRACIEWVNKDGDIKEHWVDETRLVDTKGNPVVPLEDQEPGPGNDPVRRGI